ncbi:MAG TPA: 4Fe-4S binding protein, partial [Anaeromyxobacteraceae bacterium]|nr:4Fe-4S binding protein [Anaeromyxobacteraceae bacterium]
LAAAVVSARWSDPLVEVEPFKTAITMHFRRSWPAVAWAAGTVLAGAVIYKAFCRYLCPLGAFLALLGRVRRWDWLARRIECGHPCQTCRSRCEYQAIEAQGGIDYAECFQCMECVAIYHDDAQCAPRLLTLKGKRWATSAPAPVGPGGPAVPGADARG